jgi:hypothetical protein
MTETEAEIARQINMLAPQVEMLATAFQPLVEMLSKYLEQMGIKMTTGAVYLRKRGKLVYGIIFEGDEQALAKITPYIGGETHATAGKEEETE